MSRSHDGAAELIFAPFLLAIALPVVVIRSLIAASPRVWLRWWRFYTRPRVQMSPYARIGPIRLTDDDRVRHCHIVGSSGSGKTEATKLLIFEDIRRGRGCFIIDPKGDRSLYEEVRGFCQSVGRLGDLKLLSANNLEESSVWNPCGLGSASELQSKFYNSNTYSESFYAKACEVTLIRAFNRLIETRPQGFGFRELVATLKEIAHQEKSKALDGLFFDFESIAQSEWSKVLGCDPLFAKGREISLLDVVQRNQILFVDLPTEGKSLQSARIGKLLTQELILISGMRKSIPSLASHGGVFSVFIDEFDAFATDSFITFLNKARSSRFMIHIIHQTLSDLKRISPEFMGQILGLCNVHIIGIQHDPDDAELWARFIGTETVIKTTHQTDFWGRTGMGSEREVQEFIIPPDWIKNLRIGSFVVSVKTQGLARWVRLPLPKRYGSESPALITSNPLAGKVRGLPMSTPSSNKWTQITASIPEGGNIHA